MNLLQSGQYWTGMDNYTLPGYPKMGYPLYEK